MWLAVTTTPAAAPSYFTAKAPSGVGARSTKKWTRMPAPRGRRRSRARTRRSRAGRRARRRRPACRRRGRSRGGAARQPGRGAADDGPVHPVRSGAEQAAQARGAELELAREAVERGRPRRRGRAGPRAPRGSRGRSLRRAKRGRARPDRRGSRGSSGSRSRRPLTPPPARPRSENGSFASVAFGLRDDLVHDLARAAADRVEARVADTGARRRTRACSRSRRGSAPPGRTTKEHMSVAVFFAMAASRRGCSPRTVARRDLARERARGGDARRHVGELVARDLEARERLAERLALARVGDRLAVGELGDGDALRRRGRAARSTKFTMIGEKPRSLRR